MKLDQQLGETLKLYTTEVNAVSSRLDQLTVGMDHVQTASLGLTKMLKDKDDAERTRHRDLMQSEQRLSTSTDRVHANLELLLPALQALDMAEVLSRELSRLGSQQAQSTLSQLEGLKQLSDTVSKVGTSRDEADQKVQASLRELALLFTGLLDQGALSEEGARVLAEQQIQSMYRQFLAWQSLQAKLEEWGSAQQQAGVVTGEQQQEFARLLGGMLEQSAAHLAELRAQRQDVERLRAALETHTALSQQSVSSLQEQLGASARVLSAQLQAQHETQQSQERELLRNLDTQRGADLSPARTEMETLEVVPAPYKEAEVLAEGSGQAG